jgi:uncharacterized membrane protein YqiK
MNPVVMALLAVGGSVLLASLVLALVLKRSLREVPSGSALVLHSTSGEPKVRFERTLVIPLVQHAELLDISAKRVVIERRAASGLRCRDGGRVGLQAVFCVRVEATVDSVLAVRKHASAVSLASPTFVHELFASRFTDALETVAAVLDSTEFERERERFKHEVIEVIGSDLGGFVLDSVSLTEITIMPPLAQMQTS